MYDVLFTIVPAVAAFLRAYLREPMLRDSGLYTYVGQDAQARPSDLIWPASAAAAGCRYCGTAAVGTRCSSCGAPRGRSGR